MTIELAILWMILTLLALFVIGGLWTGFAALCKRVGAWLADTIYGRGRPR